MCPLVLIEVRQVAAGEADEACLGRVDEDGTLLEGHIGLIKFDAGVEGGDVDERTHPWCGEGEFGGEWVVIMGLDTSVQILWNEVGMDGLPRKR